MKGRMIHHTDGKQESQIYDPINNQVRSATPIFTLVHIGYRGPGFGFVC